MALAQVFNSALSQARHGPARRFEPEDGLGYGRAGREGE